MPWPSKEKQRENRRLKRQLVENRLDGEKEDTENFRTRGFSRQDRPCDLVKDNTAFDALKSLLRAEVEEEIEKELENDNKINCN
jgi:hypothetical protein